MQVSVRLLTGMTCACKAMDSDCAVLTRSTLLATLPALLRHPRATREEIISFQDERLRRLVAHAYKTVPYYRRLFDQNDLKPDDIQRVTDLAAIPITAKRDLQSLPVEEIVARGVDPKRLIVRTTSGSSGEPLTVRHTRLEAVLGGIVRLRTVRELGLRALDREASVVLRPTSTHDKSLSMSFFQRLGLYRKVRVSCLLPPEDMIRRLQDFRPNVLSGFAGVLARLAQTLSSDDRLVLRPRFVTVGGEVLTPLMRRHISEAFAAPVFNLYLSHEFNVLGWECKQTGELHTCDDSVIIEILKDGRPAVAGEWGEVVGTNLHSFAMPFMRYRLGDMVVKGSETCRCGQAFSTIRTIQGRMLDYFLLPGGRVIHPYEIVLILIHDAASWIHQYQLIQERTDRIVLQVAPFIAPSPQQLASLKGAVTTLLGQGVEFQVVLVPEIQIEPSGKFRVSRSLVQSAYDGLDWNDLQLATPHSISGGGHDRKSHE